ncbi:putative glycerol-3-phosphate dehydrogenase, partial [Toxoplasma gondii CAST]
MRREINIVNAQSRPRDAPAEEGLTRTRCAKGVIAVLSYRNGVLPRRGFPLGTLTAREVFEVISSHEVDHLFPLFTVTYDIAFKGRDPADLVRVFETREV